MLSVRRQYSKVKALCRLCELAPTWPSLPATGCISVDDLDFERLLRILEVDHAFVYGVDWLSWINQTVEGVAEKLVIENARQ